MSSEILDFNDKRCIEILKEGELLAFPTDTVYGVACIYDNYDAFKLMVNMKKRPPEKPFTLMLSQKEQIENYAFVNDKIKKVINEFLPGELTLILKAKESYPWVTMNSETIGIRVSGLDKVCNMISKVGKPLLVTSVNESGKQPLNDIDGIKSNFDEKIKGIIEYKNYQNSTLPSTIIYLIDDEIRLIREGKISFKDIKDVWEDKK